MLAEALLGLIDVDRNGRIDGAELRAVLGKLGIPTPLLLTISDSVGIDYRSLLQDLEGDEASGLEGIDYAKALHTSLCSLAPPTSSSFGNCSSDASEAFRVQETSERSSRGGVGQG